MISEENNMYSNDNKLREICEIANIKDIGDLSDGYHTFNQLYHQRAVLFATIVNQNKDISWKSFKHSDGKYCFDSNGEWFIVGIDTPEGSYTYHYEKSYWDMFKCQELECGKEWDGHTEEDVTRLLSLKEINMDNNISKQRVNKILDFTKCWVDDTVDLIHDGYTEDEVIEAVKTLFKEEGK